MGPKAQIPSDVFMSPGLNAPSGLLSTERQRLDRVAGDPPTGELARAHRVDEIRATGPQADVLHVGARRARRRREVRVEDREFVAVVFEEPRLRGHVQLEAVRRRGHVATRDVALSDAVLADDEPARFVRRLGLCVLDELVSNGRRDYHQTDRSIERSTSAASQKSAERYFQPPSARTQTTTPSSSSPASLFATCATAPEDTPPKMP